MNEYFERELLSIERELSMLKTAAQRSAGTIETVSKTISVNIPLSIDSSQTGCSGMVRYTVDVEANSIFLATLDWYHQNIMNEWSPSRISRRVGIHKAKFDDGKFGIEVYADGTNWSSDNSDDLSRLKNGQSVSIDTKLTVLCTNNFTINRV